MSGGYFDYKQYTLSDIADQIDNLIFHNGSSEQNEYGDEKYTEYSKEVMIKFKECVKLLRLTEVYVNRIDYLLSGDDGEGSFLFRLQKEIDNLKVYEAKNDEN